MGSGSWSSASYDAYSTTRGYAKIAATADNVRQFFTNERMPKYLDPFLVRVRESRDSREHPESTPVILGLDVTGSMGELSASIAKNQLNELMLEIYKTKPVSDPQVLFCMIGDHKTDDAPLQVSQFESDIRIAEQLTQAYFEGHGGGNGGESYLAAWYFAAKHTSVDSWEKRGRKGFLFTIGDECCHDSIDANAIHKIFHDDAERAYTAEELYRAASEKYEVFHLLVGSYAEQGADKYWKDLVGERAVVVDDSSTLPAVILDAMTSVVSSAGYSVSGPYDLE